MNLRNTLTLLTGALALGGVARAQCPTDLLLPPNPSDDRGYGASLASTPDALVSAVTGAQPAVVVRRRIASGDLGPPERVDLAGAQQGSIEIAADGDLIAVSFQSAFAERSVQVFRDGPAGYAFEAELVPTTPTNLDDFGRGLAVSDGRVLVGAASTTVAGVFRTGQALLFEESGGTWQESAVFRQRVPRENSFFGRALDLHGDLVAVNERNPVSPSPIPQLGVSVYREAAGGWELEASLPHAGARSGFAIALGDEVAIVGAPAYPTDPFSTAAALVYRPINGLWALRRILTPPSGDVDGFGSGLAFDGETLVVRPSGSFSGGSGDRIEVFRGVTSGTQTSFEHVTSIGPEVLGGTSARRVVPIGETLYAGLPGFGSTGAVVAITTADLVDVICEIFSTPAGVTSADLDVERGCPSPLLGDFSLRASPLPGGSFALLVVGTTSGAQQGVFGGTDTLCAQGSIGRGALRSIPALGSVSFPVDLQAIPQPGGPVAAVSGTSWVAQVVYRDPATGVGRATNALRFLVP